MKNLINYFTKYVIKLFIRDRIKYIPNFAL